MLVKSKFHYIDFQRYLVEADHKTGMSRESFGLSNYFDMSRWLRQNLW